MEGSVGRAESSTGSAHLSLAHLAHTPEPQDLTTPQESQYSMASYNGNGEFGELDLAAYATNRDYVDQADEL